MLLLLFDVIDIGGVDDVVSVRVVVVKVGVVVAFALNSYFFPPNDIKHTEGPC